MSDTGPRPFAGSQFTYVDLEGGDGLVVALPLRHLRQTLENVYAHSEFAPDTRVLIDAPLLQYNEDDDAWTIEMGSFRLDLLASLAPWTPKDADKAEVVLALGDALRAKSEAFSGWPKLGTLIPATT